MNIEDKIEVFYVTESSYIRETLDRFGGLVTDVVKTELLPLERKSNEGLQLLGVQAVDKGEDRRFEVHLFLAEKVE